MALQFRDATINDLPLVVDIYNSTVAGRIVTADTEPVTVESRMPWFDLHEPLTRPLWIVSDEDEMIGWVSFQSFYGRPAYQATAEISIYLHQDNRERGYGKQILDHSMKLSGKLGIKTLLGYIFAHNQPSLKLFMSFGFERWGVLPGIAVLDNIERDLIIVGKRINP